MYIGFNRMVFVILTWSLLSPAQEIKQIKCEDLRSRQVIVNGTSYTKYEIDDSGYMKCIPPQPSAPWIVKKQDWSMADEIQFGNFLKALGRSNCNTVDSCLSSDANILRSEIDLQGTHYADCADFPFYLRAYFAFKNGLPYAYTMAFTQAPLTEQQIQSVEMERQKVLQEEPDKIDEFEGRQNDKRYSRNGNIPTQKYFIPSINGASRDFFRIAPNIHNFISSGTLRMLKSPEGSPLPDFYSPAVNPQSIRAGTVLYNVSGHVAIVYDVTPNGDVLYLDSHPDNSVSRGSFNYKFRVLRSTYGGNFKNFRPFVVENVRRNPKDPSQIISGQFRFFTDEEISDYSLEQYDGTQERGQSGDPVYTFALGANQAAFEFYDWVKLRLSGGTYRVRPEIEIAKEMKALCDDVRDRLDAVNKAVGNKIHLQPHPATLPSNIFGAAGEWESYSTPGRDMRLKERILGIASTAKDLISKHRSRHPLIDYRGSNLNSDILRAYHNGIWKCQLAYNNSKGNLVPLSLALLIDRISQLSYDPYNCPERRMGATSQVELATCTDDAEKAEWHVLQQFFRNSLEKNNLATHGQSLDELRNLERLKKVNNSDSSKRFNLIELLKGLQ